MKSRLIEIIPKSYRRRATIVVATIFLRALLNFIGVATLIPLLTLMLDGNNAISNTYLSAIYNALSPDSYRHFVVMICGMIAGVIILKNIANILLYRFERNYIYALYRHYSKQLYTTYYSRGLGFMKQSNSTLLSRNVNVVSLMFVAGILKPIATIISEAILISLLLAALTWYSPTVSLLVIGIFLPIVALFYLSMRHKLYNIGQRENELQRTKSRIVNETFKGYVDIEINNAFPQMLKQFDSITNDIISLRKQNATLSLLPQAFTEIGLTIGMSVLIIISVGNISIETAMLFGIFAIAAVRVIPSIRGIMSAWSTIRFNRYSIDIIAEASCNINATAASHNTERIDFRESIEIKDVTFKYDDAESPVINNLSLKINKGECLGIQGTSGIGKTTLFNLILGLHRPTTGEITIDGVALKDENTRKWQNSIGYVSQNVFIADMTIAENIALGNSLDNIDYNLINEVIELSDLKSYIETLPQGVDSKIGEHGCKLSGGQRQRIGIARALYKGCNILLLDEATSSLDGQTEENINNAIRQLAQKESAMTIVIIAHRDSSLEYCNRIITLE